MNQIVTTEKQDSPVNTSKKFFTVRKFARKNKEHGCWPDSDLGIWALKAGSPENGFGDAFLKVGRRVLINEEKFWEAIDRLQEDKNASKK